MIGAAFFKIANAQKLTPDDVINFLNKTSIDYPHYFVIPFKDTTYTYYIFDLSKDFQGNDKYIKYSRYFKNNRIASLKDLSNDTPQISCLVDITKFDVERKTSDGISGCSEIIRLVDMSLIDARNNAGRSDLFPELKDMFNKKVAYCFIGYRCELRDVLNIYLDGLKYLSSIFKANRASQVFIENPFKNEDLSPMGVRLNRRGSIFFIAVKLQNEVIDFVFDSGASDCSISKDAFDRLYQSYPNIFTPLQDGLYTMADGTIKKQKRFLVKELEISGRKIQNIEVTISPIGSPNLLGNSFLQLFKKWTLNQHQQMLILEY